MSEINRIKSDAALTIKEYEERYLKPWRERVEREFAEGMKRQWAEDAAFWGWKPRPWWQRVLIRLRLMKPDPELWERLGTRSGPGQTYHVRLPSDFKVIDRTPLA